MSLTSALQDVRKMRRSVTLREETDPEVVSDTLNTILKEAIALRSSGAGLMGKGAVNELKNIRRALVAGNIDVGNKTGEYIGKYSAVLDQITGVEQESKQQVKNKSKNKKAGKGGGLVDNVVGNLPSADTIIAAVTAANPVLGYTAKIAKNTITSASQNRKERREYERKQLEKLNAEKEVAENKVEEVKEENPGSAQEAEVVARLDMINQNIQALVDIWGPLNNSKVEKLEESLEESNQLLERIEDETEDANRANEVRESEKGLLQSEADYERSTAGNLDSSAGGDGKGGGFGFLGLGRFAGLAGLGGMVGGALGAVATKVLRPFIAIWNFMTKGATILGRLGRFTGILTALYTMYDFVDGFISAGDYIDGEVSITDRIKTGMASVIAGLLSPVDWILDFFDMGFMDSKEQFTNDLINSSSGLVQFLLSPIAWITDFIKDFNYEEFKEDAKENIDSMFDFFSNFFSDMKDSVANWFKDKKTALVESEFGKSVSGTVETVKDSVGSAFSVGKDYTVGLFDNVTGYFRDEAESDLEENKRSSRFDLDEGTGQNGISESNTTSNSMTKSMREADNITTNNTTNASGGVLAQDNRQTTVNNNTTLQSGTGADNNDRTWRRFNDQYQFYMQ